MTKYTDLTLQNSNTYNTPDKKYTVQDFLGVKGYDYVETRPYDTLMKDHLFRGKSIKECVDFLNSYEECLDQRLFTDFLKTKISCRLIDYFGPKMDTKKPHLERTSYASTFYSTVMNSIPDILTDYCIAGYKIDDSHDVINGGVPGTAAKERMRLMNDVATCPNIVLFITDKLLFNL